MLRLGIVDVHEAFRVKFCQHMKINSHLTLTLCADSGLSLIKNLQSTDQEPDILFINIRMPVIDGISLTNYITKHFPKIICVGLSSLIETKQACDYIASGGKAYVTKQFFSQELHFLFEALDKGEIYVDRAIKNPELSRLQQHSQQAPLRLDINKKEVHFLELCAGSDFSYSEIADIMHVAEDTLKNYKKSLKEKFGLFNRASYVRFALQHEIIYIAKYGNTERL